MSARPRRPAASARTRRVALSPRAQPRQERARATVERILDTAGRLLEEAGLEGFNTNRLARRAGVRVRTIYRYFPNKLAVMVALTRRMAGEWDSWFGGFEALADPGRDAGEVWEGYLDAYLEGLSRQPGSRVIRRAMQATPELRAVEEEDNEGLAARIADALRRRGVPGPATRRRTAGRLLLETGAAVVDLSLRTRGAEAAALRRELRLLHRGYLEALGAGASPPRSRGRK